MTLVTKTKTKKPAKIKSCFNYMGGKMKILDKIQPHFPENIKTMIEPFCGGLSVTLNTKAERYLVNDIDVNIISLYKLIKQFPSSYILERIKNTIDSLDLMSKDLTEEEFRSSFLKLRDEFNKTKNPLLIPIISAIAFGNQIRYNSNNLCNSSFGKKTINKDWFLRFKTFIYTVKSKNIVFDSFDYKNISSYFDIFKDDLFVYLDPPYSITGASYNRLWPPEEDVKLFKWIDETIAYPGSKIKFAFSNVYENKGLVNEPLIKWVKSRGFKMVNIQVDYRNSVQGKKLTEDYKPTKEVLIKNY